MNNTDSRNGFPLIMSKNNNVNNSHAKLKKIRLYKMQSNTSCIVCNAIFQNSCEFSTKWH